MASIATNLPRVLGPALKKRGVAVARLIAHWPTVVGDELARVSVPERMIHSKDGGGTLVITVAGPFALEMQHLEPLVLEKINGFLGQTTVSRLRLEQGTVPGPKPKPRPRPAPAADPETEARLETLLSDVEDEDLRGALRRLGRSILVKEG